MSFLFSLYHYIWAFLGNVFFLFPSRKIFVVGVTGTKGKSTTLEIMSAIMDETGEKNAVLSSVTKKIGEKMEKNKTGNSMPGRMVIQKFLREAVRAKCTYAFIEVTSQGIVQHRHKCIDWDCAVFTNLSPEHIESHGSYEAYKQAKLSFFSYVSKSNKHKHTFLINKEDKEADTFRETVQHNLGSSVLFSSKTDFLRWIADFVDITSDRAREKFNKWIFADFNLENSALAQTFAINQGVSSEVIIKALSKFKGVSGRFEVVQQKPFTVVVDYAHTPDSLEKAYSVAKKEYCELPTNSLICVLGAAGGGRDKWKREEFGKIAGSYCSEIVLTNEDPFDEDQNEIIDEIKKGILKTRFPDQNIKIILDRREAIHYALTRAQKGDVVIGTGKGSEEWIRWEKGRKESWNERRVFEEELEKI
jgi:UDP-N-acetylmuramoyl-L-alanyl-D-glutamate--2,6-diaminopimelate ligase